MKKPFPILCFLFMLVGCIEDHKNTTPQILAQLAKKFSAQSVDENNITVYTKGGASNIRPGYNKLLLDLTGPGATFRDFDNNTFVARVWTVTDNNKLTLTDLDPQPSGTNGVIEFSITSISDSQVVLTRLAASEKTGGQIVKYTLTTP